MNRSIFLFALILLVFLASLSLAGIPQLINYQGMLTDNSGNPLTDTLNITFKIYNDPTAGTKKWEETQNNVPVINGLFNVILGSATPIDTLSFKEQYWLDITVGAEHMPTRLRFTSVAYAYRAQNADTAEYARGGGGGSGSPWIFRTSDGSDTTITTGGGWGVARFGNQLFGNADSTHVNLGVACTTGTSGQNYKYCTVGGGRVNTASNDYATVGGGYDNTASYSYATVGGGYFNAASDNYATVGGGRDNTASWDYATVSGGVSNTASNVCATVGGGSSDTARGSYATVGGGRNNSASDWYATIGGGYRNKASNYYATIAGGHADTASGYESTVGGGNWNVASGGRATIGGGGYNTVSGDYATIGGGKDNTASGDSSTIGGGTSNTASAMHATVGGGQSNAASYDYATIGGGGLNRAGNNSTVGGGYNNTAGYSSAVGGGLNNLANGYEATIPGGYADTAAGDCSFAAGQQVRITSVADHTFAFGNNFSTSTPNAVIFYHTGEATRVGINLTNPTYAVHLPNINGAAGKGMAYAWNTYSSVRWKENINPIDHALNKVLALRGVYFDWKEQKRHDIGMIAEEVGRVIPEVVSYTENGMDAEGLDYARLTALLVEAMKEQQVRIDAQQEQIEILKAKLEDLESNH